MTRSWSEDFDNIFRFGFSFLSFTLNFTAFVVWKIIPVSLPNLYGCHCCPLLHGFAADVCDDPETEGWRDRRTQHSWYTQYWHFALDLSPKLTTRPSTQLRNLSLTTKCYDWGHPSGADTHVCFWNFLPYLSVSHDREPFKNSWTDQYAIWNVDSFCSLAIPNPRAGHTMDTLSPFISVLCHFDWLFHRESCPHLDVHPGCAWSSSPACTWHCSLHYLFLLATPLLPHALKVYNSSLFTPALLRTQ